MCSRCAARGDQPGPCRPVPRCAVASLQEQASSAEPVPLIHVDFRWVGVLLRSTHTGWCVLGPCGVS